MLKELKIIKMMNMQINWSHRSSFRGCMFFVKEYYDYYKTIRGYP